MSLYLTVAVPRLNAYYGEGIDPVVLHSLSCTGNEDSLTSCSSRNVPNQVPHAIDAGVYCYTSYSECAHYCNCMPHQAIL